MKIIYINLQHEINRRYRLLKEFKKSNISSDEYEQYASLWGRNIGQKLISLLIKNEKLVNSRLWLTNFNALDKCKLAIYLSHVFLWEKIYNDYIGNDKTEYGWYNLILEDDVILPLPTKKFIYINNNKSENNENQNNENKNRKTLIQSRLQDKIEDNLKNVPEDWDMLFIGRSKYLDGVKVAPNIIKPNPVHKSLTNHGMFAYIVKTSSIPKLLKIMLPVPPTYNHVDWKVRSHYTHANTTDTTKSINAYYLEKPLVTHNYKIPSIREQERMANRYTNMYMKKNPSSLQTIPRYRRPH